MESKKLTIKAGNISCAAWIFLYNYIESNYIIEGCELRNGIQEVIMTLSDKPKS